MIQILVFIIWLIDILNIDFTIRNIQVAYYLDEVIPINFWFWLLFWVLCPSTVVYKESKD